MFQNFVTNFCYQLLYNSVVAMFIGIAMLLFRIITCKKWEPRGKMAAWIIFILVLIFPVTIPSPLSIYHWMDMRWFQPESKQYSNDVLSLAEETNVSEIYHEIKDKIFVNINENKSYLSKWVFRIGLLIGILKLIYAISGRIYVWYEIRYCPKGDERVYAIVEECKRKLKIKRKIEVIEQEVLHEPGIIGLFNLKILITPEILPLSDKELQCIIMHELSHYKRKDMVLNWLIVILDAFYWFNPVDTVLLQFMQLDLEAATDILAFKNLENVKEADYNHTLLKVYHVSRGDKAAILGFLGQEKKLSIGQKIKLLTRMQAINEKEFFVKHPILMFGITLFFGLIMLFAFYPNSYSDMENPQLYLKSEDGNQINLSEEEVVEVSEKSHFKLVAEGGNCKKMVMYEVYDLSTQKRHFYATNLNEEFYLEEGECEYQFVLECLDGRTVHYTAKILSGY